MDFKLWLILMEIRLSLLDLEKCGGSTQIIFHITWISYETENAIVWADSVAIVKLDLL